ncbi:uncharacterized protein LOC131851825 [Achroia grisella]|uniref:uncharacterized protein LOC131851825 n=1 Tax=Achroia grisella TaxID=688607 RepID=UPI0027D207FC|nr:uncharacterized protein LOC131851825 [Achroia grisella]
MEISNPTVEQVHTLLTFLAEHQELARGHCRNAEGRTRSTQLWVRLTDELNALGGCTKTVKQWQKVWADKKYLTKKAATAARRSATATGVGPSSADPLNPIQCRILGIMGEGFGEPQSDAHVPAFPENFNGYYTSRATTPSSRRHWTSQCTQAFVRNGGAANRSGGSTGGRVRADSPITPGIKCINKGSIGWSTNRIKTTE